VAKFLRMDRRNGAGGKEVSSYYYILHRGLKFGLRSGLGDMDSRAKICSSDVEIIEIFFSVGESILWLRVL